VDGDPLHRPVEAEESVDVALFETEGEAADEQGLGVQIGIHSCG
jgi:hypothetical protein